MKPTDIQRGISSRHGRSGGDAPNIGRVSRLRDAEFEPAARRVRRRDDESNPARRKAILIWSAMLSIVTLAIIGVAVFIWLMPRLAPPPVSANTSQEDLGRHEARVRVASRFPSPSRELALDLVKKAITNRDPEKLPSLFRMGDASSDEILFFLKDSERKDGPVERYEWLSSMDVNGMLLEGILVGYKMKDKPVERIAFLTPDSVGNWKMDFGAFARTVRPSWDDLLEKGAEKALLRVFVGKDSYYNGPFSDEKEWICYGIATPDTEVLLRGYCKIGSPQAAAMDQLFTFDRKLSRATLEIKRVKDAGPRQFEITRLVAEDWVVAEDGE